MIRPTAKFLSMAGMIAFAAAGNAGTGTGTVSPALAACSKALVESISTAEKVPTYSVRSPSLFASEIVDPNSFTVLAHSTKTKELLAKASCKATSTGEILSFKSIPLKS